MDTGGSIIKKNNCCVCAEESDILSRDYSQCPSDHNICKTCYLSILQMCYCENTLGEIMYKCPLCRNEHRFSNQKMNDILLKMIDSSELCVRVHKICEPRNITKKCQFEKCGCRTNVVDIITRNEIDLAIKDILNVAGMYSVKGLKSPRSRNFQKISDY